ncbi:MAG: ABC transporter permease [Lachnospiraceae bacterium]|nr:ABC transporter permease [Lachnospiraceae bacterium]MBO4788905.1 ABC transporter permease [Lachnospiraceae bacterium]MBQ2031816.1 ABC transporter permease [Lachnospiraceae bacterium]MBQ3979339.1 ABC transporter permease [Lachnospiraceae bacterium]MCR5375936.1 ABC transporter permease [Lachnospiraceae bacterium]
MKQFRRMTYPYIVWALILIVAPMLLIVLYAFTTKGNDVVTTKFTLENFARFFSDRLFLKVLLRSLKVAAITTIACLLLGYFPAYYIAKSSETFKMHWVLIITFPTWINLLVRTYAWIGILQDDGIINTVLGWIGLGPYKMMYTEFAVILGMVYNFLPFMILQIYTSLTKMDGSLLEAASDLGANKFQSFLRVTLPLSLPGIISGITLVFLPAVSSFCIPNMLGGGQYMLVGNVIEQYFLSSGDWNFGSAISMIMAVIIILSMYLTKKVDVTEKGEARA